MAVCRRMDSVKFWRRLRRPTSGLVLTSALLITGLAWSQAEPGGDSSANTDPAVGAAADAGTVATSDDSAVALLDAFVAEVRDLAAGFEQSRFDESGELRTTIA